MAPIEHPATGEATSCWYAAIGSESCPDIPEATPGSCREGGVFWLRGRSVALPASGARQDVRSEGLGKTRASSSWPGATAGRAQRGSSAHRSSTSHLRTGQAGNRSRKGIRQVTEIEATDIT